MVQIEDGQIIRFNLPKTGILKDGRTVSGYHLLGEDILRDEGWLPLQDNPPEYDEETQYLIQDGYEVLEDKVIKKYRVEDIPEPQLSEVEVYKNKIAELEKVIDTMLGDDVIE